MAKSADEEILKVSAVKSFNDATISKTSFLVEKILKYYPFLNSVIKKIL